MVAPAIEAPRFQIVTSEAVEPVRMSFQEFFPYLAPNGPVLAHGRNDAFSYLDFNEISPHMRRIDGYVGNIVYMFDKPSRDTLLADGDIERAHTMGSAEGGGTIYYNPRKKAVKVTTPFDTGTFRDIDFSADIAKLYSEGNVPLILGHQHPYIHRQPEMRSASPPDMAPIFMPAGEGRLVRGFMIFGHTNGKKWQRFYSVTDQTPLPNIERAEALMVDGHVRAIQREKEEARKARTEQEMFERVERVRVEVEREYVEGFHLRVYAGENMRDFDQVDYSKLVA